MQPMEGQFGFQYHTKDVHSMHQYGGLQKNCMQTPQNGMLPEQQMTNLKYMSDQASMGQRQMQKMGDQNMGAKRHQMSMMASPPVQQMGQPAAQTPGKLGVQAPGNFYNGGPPVSPGHAPAGYQQAQQPGPVKPAPVQPGPVQPGPVQSGPVPRRDAPAARDAWRSQQQDEQHWRGQGKSRNKRQAGLLQKPVLNFDENSDGELDIWPGRGASGRIPSKPEFAKNPRTDEHGKMQLEGPCFLKMLMPNHITGALIGKEGVMIGEILMKTRCQMQISEVDTFFPGTTDRIVVMGGTMKELEQCIQLSLRRLKDVSGKGERKERSQLLTKLAVPSSAVSGLIGHQGEKVKKLSDQMNCRINMSGRQKGMNERLVLICGEYQHLVNAVIAIAYDIQGDAHLKDNLHLHYEVRLPLGAWSGERAQPADPEVPLIPAEDAQYYTKREIIEYLHKAAPREILLKHNLLGNMKNTLKSKGSDLLKEALKDTLDARMLMAGDALHIRQRPQDALIPAEGELSGAAQAALRGLQIKAPPSALPVGQIRRLPVGPLPIGEVHLADASGSGFPPADVTRPVTPQHTIAVLQMPIKKGPGTSPLQPRQRSTSAARVLSPVPQPPWLTLAGATSASAAASPWLALAGATSAFAAASLVHPVVAEPGPSPSAARTPSHSSTHNLPEGAAVGLDFGSQELPILGSQELPIRQTSAGSESTAGLTLHAFDQGTTGHNMNLSFSFLEPGDPEPGDPGTEEPFEKSASERLPLSPNSSRLCAGGLHRTSSMELRRPNPGGNAPQGTLLRRQRSANALLQTVNAPQVKSLGGPTLLERDELRFQLDQDSVKQEELDTCAATATAAQAVAPAGNPGALLVEGGLGLGEDWLGEDSDVDSVILEEVGAPELAVSRGIEQPQPVAKEADKPVHSPRRQLSDQLPAVAYLIDSTARTLIDGINEKVDNKLALQVSTMTTATFSPGLLGMGADWSTGEVMLVGDDGQAHCMGVKVGSFMHLINDGVYTKRLLDEKIEGTEDYKLTFAANREATSVHSWSKINEDSGSRSAASTLSTSDRRPISSREIAGSQPLDTELASSSSPTAQLGLEESGQQTSPRTKLQLARLDARLERWKEKGKKHVRLKLSCNDARDDIRLCSFDIFAHWFGGGGEGEHNDPPRIFDIDRPVMK